MRTKPVSRGGRVELVAVMSGANYRYLNLLNPRHRRGAAVRRFNMVQELLNSLLLVKNL